MSKATHYIAGLSWENKDYLFSAEGYYKALADLTQYSLRFSSVRDNRSYSEAFYTGKGYAQDIGLMAQKKTKRRAGHGWAAAGWRMMESGHAGSNLFSSRLKRLGLSTAPSNTARGWCRQLSKFTFRLPAILCSHLNHHPPVPLLSKKESRATLY